MRWVLSQIVPVLVWIALAFGVRCLAQSAAPPAHKAPSEPDRVVVHGAESALDTRYDYFRQVLRAAMEKTRGEFGDYVWEEPGKMSHHRQMDALRENKLTVMIQTATTELEKDFVPVRIPIDRGLLGYRVFLIRAADAPKFAAIRTVEDLRRFSVGQGAGWLDAAVWQHAGVRVLEGSSYDGLFEMLARGRFDFFSRGVGEAVDEYDARKKDMPEIAIERTLCVYYPWPRYFYCSNTPQGHRLAARLEKGLESLIREKTEFNAIFEKHFGDCLRRLDLKSRRFLQIENPILPPDTPLDRKEFWFNPVTDLPGVPAPEAKPKTGSVTGP